MFDLNATPGLLLVVGACFPLLGALLLAWAAVARLLLREHSEKPTFLGRVHTLLGGEQPAFGPGVIMILTTGLAFMFGLLGMGIHTERTWIQEQREQQAGREVATLQKRAALASPPRRAELEKELARIVAQRDADRAAHQREWNGRVAWLQVQSSVTPDTDWAGSFPLGFRVDGVAILFFLVIALVALLLNVYALAYHDEETREVEDPQVRLEFGGFRRRGRLSRFSLFLGLLTSALLFLVISDNLVQVFVCWQVVTVCACVLVGFWYERSVVNVLSLRTFLLQRAGDAGFLLGLLILWSAVGTVTFTDLEQRLRAPLEDRQGLVDPGGQFVHVENVEESGQVRVVETGQGGQVLILPLGSNARLAIPRVGDEVAAAARPGPGQFGVLSVGWLTLAGCGLLIGCLAGAAQFPWQGWLTESTVGPLPVMALLNTVGSVAVSVYVLGRIYPILTPTVLILLAYLGLIGLVGGALLALWSIELPRILIFSTISTLGLIFLGLGIGAWSGGLFHILTHAVAKATLFLGVGAILYATGGQTDLRKLGGLALRMPLTALAMLLATLALSGMPFLAPWYSGTAILEEALGYVLVHPGHLLLFLGPLVVAGLTAFTLFRLWILAFQGLPREPRSFLQAEEPPTAITFPTVVLALLAVTLGWGVVPWDPHGSWVENELHDAQPLSVQSDFGTVPERNEIWQGAAIKPPAISERLQAQHYGWWAVLLNLLVAGVGVFLAQRWYAPRELLTDGALRAALGLPAEGQLPQRPALDRPRLWDEQADLEEETVPVVEEPAPVEEPVPVGSSPPVAPVPRPAMPTEPGPWVTFVAGGLGLNSLCRVLFVDPAQRLGRWLSWLEGTPVDGCLRRLGGGLRTLAWVGGFLDRMLDAILMRGSRLVWDLSGWLRSGESGSPRWYLLVLVLATVGLVFVIRVLGG